MTPPAVVGLLLVPGFSLMSYAAAAEPLRAANELSGRNLYRWRHIALSGGSSVASNGLSILADDEVGTETAFHTVLVCAAGNPARFSDARTLRWLRRIGRSGTVLGGVSGGAYVLARAGLLDGRRCTIHWEHAAAFAEAFPAVDLRRTLFEIDRDRVTCAGGIAALDMMTALIARDHGPDLSARVSDWFLQPRPRLGTAPQRMGLKARTGIGNAHVLAALSLMEANIEAPLTIAALAARIGISARQMERLFGVHAGEAVAARYLAIRLERARSLLRETALPLAEIAAACGFQSASHFSRRFAARYGRPPSRMRGT